MLNEIYIYSFFIICFVIDSVSIFALDLGTYVIETFTSYFRFITGFNKISYASLRPIITILLHLFLCAI
jgi:hypothetical protein